MTLRERCKAFRDLQMKRAMMRIGDPVQDLVEFVLVERGRSADIKLEHVLPLVMYFHNEADRDEMIAAVLAEKPGIFTRKLP